MAAPKKTTRLAKCCNYCRIVTTFFCSHVGLCALVLGYAVGGAFLFSLLEEENEETVRLAFKDKRDYLVSILWELTENQTVLIFENWTDEARTHLNDFEEELIKTIRKDGYDGLEAGDTHQWSFTGALLYSIIVITTIGYGNIAPKTTLGRLCTMCYAIVGIPLTLLCLSNIGDVMAHSFKFIYWKVCYAFCIKPRGKKKKLRKRRRRKRRRRQISPQGIMPIERIQMQTMTSSPAYGAPYMAPGMSSYTLPSSGGRHVRQGTRQFSDHHDANQVPIISNKYALQSDLQSESLEMPPMGTFPGAHGLRGHLGRPFGPIPGNSLSVPLNSINSTRLPLYPPIVSQPVQFPQITEEYSSEEDSESEEEDEDEDDEEEGNVPIAMCMGLVIGYICGGAVLFRQWETTWTFLDSAYFCFITLTTIGFGDMVPGGSMLATDSKLPLVYCALYLLFGMALLAMSFNLVQEEVAKSVREIGKKIGIVSDDGDDKSN